MPVASAIPEDSQGTVSTDQSRTLCGFTLPLQITNPPLAEADQAAEAARAYNQALVTLATLAHSREPDSNPSNSVITSFQGQGPFGSVVRIAVKLYQRLWNKSVLNSGFKKRRIDEIHGKAVKVKDLLQHSAELGNHEALYKLAQISLVRLSFYDLSHTWHLCRCVVSTKLLLSF